MPSFGTPGPRGARARLAAAGPPRAGRMLQLAGYFVGEVVNLLLGLLQLGLRLRGARRGPALGADRFAHGVRPASGPAERPMPSSLPALWVLTMNALLAGSRFHVCGGEPVPGGAPEGGTTIRAIRRASGWSRFALRWIDDAYSSTTDRCPSGYVLGRPREACPAGRVRGARRVADAATRLAGRSRRGL